MLYILHITPALPFNPQPSLCLLFVSQFFRLSPFALPSLLSLSYLSCYQTSLSPFLSFALTSISVFLCTVWCPSMTVVGNKIDLDREVTTEEAAQLVDSLGPGFSYIETSAKTRYSSVYFFSFVAECQKWPLPRQLPDEKCRTVSCWPNFLRTFLESSSRCT